ncbi:MAG: geranylgeranyl reductase family protein [Dehalococcoidia bacterium]
MIYDAVVIGAGPAGSAAARDVARHGFKTLLLEEHPTIGQPLHCAGLVTPRTLAMAQVPEAVVVNPLRGAYINTTGPQLRLGGDRSRAVVMDRVQFDREMARQAQEAGAELLLASRAAAMERTDGLVRLQVERRGKATTVLTRLVIAADGAHSHTARWLGLRPRFQEMLAGLGIEARGQPRSEAMVEVFVGQDIAPGFFAWMIPLGNRRLRIGIATADGSKPIHYLSRLVAAFPRHFRGVEFVQFYGGTIPLRLWDRTYDDNVMLVGDAAGQVKPTSGGGIYMGLVGAKHCADVAISALGRDDLSAAFLSQYQRHWTADIGGELQQGVVLRRLYLSASNTQVQRALAILSQPYLRRIINAAGDIDYPSVLFRRLTAAAPFILRLLGLSLPSPA